MIEYQTLTVWKDGSHFEIAGGESYDGRLVQLAGNGRRKRKQFGQFVELGVLLLASRLRRVFRLVFHRRRRRRLLRPTSSTPVSMQTEHSSAVYLARSAKLLTGLYILSSVSFFFLNLAKLSRDPQDIFTNFSPNGRYLCECCQSGPAFLIPQGTLPLIIP